MPLLTRLAYGFQSVVVTGIFQELPPLQKEIGELDDSLFQMLLKETHVLESREFRDWNWNYLSELTKQANFNGKRFDSGPLPRFLQRLLLFYQPSQKLYSKQSIDRERSIFTQVGVQLLRVLLASEEGRKVLQSHKLLPDLAAMFKDFDTETSEFLNHRTIKYDCILAFCILLCCLDTR